MLCSLGMEAGCGSAESRFVGLLTDQEKSGAFGTGSWTGHVMYESAARVKLQILLGEAFSLGFGSGWAHYKLQAGMTRACRAQTKVASLVRDVFPLAALARSVHPNDFIERKCFLLESPFLKMAAVGFPFRFWRRRPLLAVDRPWARRTVRWLVESPVVIYTLSKEQEHVRRGFRIHPEASFPPLWFAGGKCSGGTGAGQTCLALTRCWTNPA
jgi:hypothetical protein